MELEAPQTALSNLGKPSTSLTEQLWIRLVSAPGADPRLVSISKIFANGTLWTLAPGSAEIQTAGGVGSPYFLLFDLDFSQRWYVEGTATLNLDGGNSRERPAINCKFTETIGEFEPIPVPGTLALLIAGLLGTGVGRRLAR